jgi:ribosomal protein S27E
MGHEISSMKNPLPRPIAYEGRVLAVRCTHCSEELASTDGIHCVYCGALLSDPLATTPFVRPDYREEERATPALKGAALVMTLLVGGWLLTRWKQHRTEE